MRRSLNKSANLNFSRPFSVIKAFLKLEMLEGCTGL